MKLLSIKINKNKRQVISILLTVILAGFVVGLLWSKVVPSEKTIEYADYHYIQNAEFDYTVHLLPNEVFSEDMLYPGQAYVTALTDYITVNFGYSFVGEQEAEISGNYNIRAELVALMAQDQDDQLLWSKKYNLVPRQDFTTNDREFYLTETFAIPFAEYLELTERIQSEIKVSPAVLNLVVRCEVNLTAETGNGVVSENLVPMMIIPLRSATFTVDSNLVEETEGSLTKTRIIPILPVIMARTVLPIAVPAAAVILILFLMVTTSTEMNLSHQEREVSRILKTHKERIIKTSGNIPLIKGKLVNVNSIRDLLRLADEVGKPIIYTESIDEVKHRYYFMVYTPELIYLYWTSYNLTPMVVTSRKDRLPPVKGTRSLSYVSAIVVLLVLIFVFSGLFIAYTRY